MRASRFFFSTVILFSCLSEAHLYVWPLVLKVRAERNDEQALESRINEFPSLSIGFSQDKWIVSLETSRFSHSSDSGNVSIKTTYGDLSAWGGYSLWKGSIWDFYAIAGLGMYDQKVETSVGGFETSNKSNEQGMFGLGAEYLLSLNVFALSTGARFNWTQDLDPSLMPEFYLRIGLGF